MTIITRFAPSPTGYLHIGGGRTALFNYYYAKRHGGKFLLRIEDTDRERSTPEAVDALISGLKWLGINWDGEPVFQFPRAARHAEVAHELVKRGAAYYCYMTPEEIEAERAKAETDGKMWHYDRRWRDSNQTPPAGVKPVVRIKAPIAEGHQSVTDTVKGTVELANDQLDDFIILRSDGVPTYMLAVVVDDHDMGVTHVIRGQEHFVNAFRQNLIHSAMGWDVPTYAHAPLIHDEHGKKMSKRTGAAAIEDYRDMGYLPQAMRNYLLRLGWSHGDEEIISDEKAAQWFDLEHIGKAPANWDYNKLNFINHHYIKLRDNKELLDLIKPVLEKKAGTLNAAQLDRILKAMPGLKERSKTLLEMAETAEIYIKKKELDSNAQEKLAQAHAPDVLKASREVAVSLSDWNGKAFIDAVLAKTGFKMGQVGPVLRIALTGTMQSPDLTEVITALGSDEVKRRLGA